jgi:hypothetical protein
VLSSHIISFHRDVGDARTQQVSPFTETKETSIDSKRLLSLRQRRHTYTRCISFHRARGDVGSQHVSSVLSSCNRLSVDARYQSHLWAHRNNHFT